MKLILILIVVVLFMAGCQTGRHSGHIYIHNPDHIEAVFDRPMSMEIEKDGIKVKASSIKPGFFEDILKFLLLRPR